MSSSVLKPGIVRLLDQLGRERQTLVERFECRMWFTHTATPGGAEAEQEEEDFTLELGRIIADMVSGYRLLEEVVRHFDEIASPARPNMALAGVAESIVELFAGYADNVQRVLKLTAGRPAEILRFWSDLLEDLARQRTKATALADQFQERAVYYATPEDATPPLPFPSNGQLLALARAHAPAAAWYEEDSREPS